MAAIVYKTRYDFKNAQGDLDPASLKGTPADLDYLARNIDVADAVNRGEFVSGYDHYLQYGKAEYENNGDPTMKFGTLGYDAVKSQWPYKRFYNLSLNDSSGKASLATRKNAIIYVLIGLVLIAAVIAYKKYGKKIAKG